MNGADGIPESVDVLVVGAGPGGLAAALRLAREGVCVRVVDARRRIGVPLRCGELTRPGLFDVLGVEERPGWIRWRLENDEGTFVIHRPRLERDLAAVVSSHDGAGVHEATAAVAVGPYERGRRRVTLRDGAGERHVSAALVIAADGVSSRVAEMAGLSTRLGLREMASCLAWRVAGARLASPRTQTFAFLRDLVPYYFWVIPSGEGEAHVGLTLPGSRGHAARPLLERAVAASRQIRGGRVVETIVGSYPSAAPLRDPVADGLLVVGAAARLVHPLMGEGIWFAARSGRLAAEAYLAAPGRSTTASSLGPFARRLSPILTELARGLEARRAREQR